MVALVVAGEAIFFLPFVIARVFRPTLLDVFGLTNLEFGITFSVYGVVAMAAYFFGGPLADKFQARKLMAAALIATSIGGFLMYTIPTLTVLKWLYGFWGLTTILLFWAALIRATREWGGRKLQGSAFGILDAGRGLAAATVGSVAIAIFAYVLPSDVVSASLEERTTAFKSVILFFTLFTTGVAILIWLALPNANTTTQNYQSTSKGLASVLKMPSIWTQAIIIICAYVGYKVTDDFSLLARDVLGFDEVKAAGVGTMVLWIRPVGAILAGVLADKFKSSKIIMYGFILMMLGSLMLGTSILAPSAIAIYFFAIISTSVAVFGLRGIYFSMMEEGKIPIVLTGTAVGVISVVGFTPDIFVGPLIGYLLDSAPGALGHQNVFLMLAFFSSLGFLATLAFRRFSKR